MSTPADINFNKAPGSVTTGIYIAQPGQSLYDVCLQIYGTLDLLYKLIQDNGIPSTTYADIVGKSFVYDLKLIKNSSTFDRNKTDGVTYATLFSPPKGITATNVELREDGGYELREDGTLELRD